MLVVYAVKGIGYGTGSLTPIRGILSREFTAVFGRAEDANRWRDLNVTSYNTLIGPVAVVVTNQDFEHLVRSNHHRRNTDVEQLLYGQ